MPKAQRPKTLMAKIKAQRAKENKVAPMNGDYFKKHHPLKSMDWTHIHIILLHQTKLITKMHMVVMRQNLIKNNNR